MYRSSYSLMRKRDPIPLKSYAIPGYAGFVPGLKSNDEYGQNYTSITKKLLNNPDLGYNKYGLSSTGSNWKNVKYERDEAISSSHKFGKQTWTNTHPAWWTRTKISQNADTYRDPRGQTAPTFSETNPRLENHNPMTRTSGFNTNCLTFDGIGWVPERVLDAPRDKTEYRDNFNTEKPYHRNPSIFKIRKLGKSSVVSPSTKKAIVY
eukprot:TRINITY_DN16009_c0_g1_i1.p1 TRINITY_DN16009_c0_g1~~TRINITY_DN16009_c0_g1_i1.p1  ORF type:complete len:207 (-),score=26.48 TRINITY_DN16009_c0_g1_i1:89-709(-)